MNYLGEGWSFDPLVIAVGAVVVVHECGLARLRARSDPQRTSARRRRSYLFYGGLAMLVLTIVSPIDYFASDYFFVHMIEHVVIMFFAPAFVVLGAPWTPLVHGIPLALRRPLVRFFSRSPATAPLRVLAGVLTRPVVDVLALNVVMIAWHIPVAFDAAEENQALHIWVMHSSMFLVGVAFWLQILPSPPYRQKASTALQMSAIIGTNVVMFVLAMSMSIFTSHSWYSAYNHLDGVTLSPFADQQIGAAVLWVCGDFWAAPALVFVIRRAIEQEGSLSDAVDRLFHRTLGRDLLR